MKKEKFSFDVSGLSTWTDESSTELLAVAQFGSETANMTDVQVGLKGSAKLQISEVSIYMQDGSSCNITPSGDAEFTQQTITNYPVAIKDGFCMRDLETKWTKNLLKTGQKYDESDLPKMVMDEVIKLLNAKLEIADWQGDTTIVGLPNKNKYNGLLKIIDAATGVVSMTASTLNATNIRTILRDGVSKVPAALQGNSAFTFFCGYDTYTTYMNKISTDNLFNMFEDKGFGVVRIENSPYMLKAVHGLDGTNRIIGAMPDNFVVGVDGQGEEESARLWYSQNDDKVYYELRFRRGWAIKHPTEIVEYTNA